MIRHIIAAIATLLALWAMAFMYDLDQKAERYKRIQELIEKTKMEVKVEQTTQPIQQIEEPATSVAEERKKEEDEVAKKLKSLRERAGSAMAFKVSPLYKQKCSSCHGVNGEGTVGPKLIGKSTEEVYRALEDFKSGKRQNYVMYGLLSKMSDEQLKELAEEIGTFQQKLEAAAQ
jgi:cytochrome c553